MGQLNYGLGQFANYSLLRQKDVSLFQALQVIVFTVFVAVD